MHAVDASDVCNFVTTISRRTENKISLKQQLDVMAHTDVGTETLYSHKLSVGKTSNLSTIHSQVAIPTLNALARAL